MPPVLELASTYNIWDQEEDLKKDVTISCFLPTGILVLLTCKREETITNIKTRVWKEAKNYPFFNQLLDINFYIFQCINQSAEQEELLYEKRRLCDIKPFTPDLRLVPRSEDVESKVLTTKIGILIDKSLHEFDMMKNDEVDDFRLNNTHTGVSLQLEREQWSWDQKACFLFPPQVELSLELPEHLRRKLEGRQRFVCEVRRSENLSKVFEIAADPYEYPIDLITTVTKRCIEGTGEEDYVLKVPGKEEYLLGNRPLYQYKCIRDLYLMPRDQPAEFILVHRWELRVNEQLMDPLLRTLSSKVDPPPVPARQGTLFSCDIHDNVRITINRARNVNVDNAANVHPIIRVRAGIYHGGEQLHDTFISSTEGEGIHPEWNDFFEANLSIANLPRMARLCLLICSQPRKAKKDAKKGLVPLAWANITFFNYKNQLRVGSHTVFMWPALEDADLNPMGTVETNRSREATSIEVTFGTYSNDTISYPSFDKILEKAAEVVQREVVQREEEDSDPFDYIDFSRLEDVKKLVEKDQLDGLDMMEKEKLWKARTDCREHIPHSLPRILQCVQWDNCECVAQMQALLQIWPILEPGKVMELLDYKYPDITVRKYAVKCLEKLTDGELSQYLLQLVQALKYETYLDSDLGRFLLRRALKNQSIGHFFFWHLRAEMHNPAVSTRFGLLLEAYCRGNITHMRILSKQVESLSKMKMISEMVKTSDSTNDKDLLQTMRGALQQETTAENLSELISPLSPLYKLGQLRIDKCRFMDSKMRPLWLVFTNGDPAGNDVLIMYKNGDDLRQDMLTLQVMQIMDNIWKAEGLDLRLIPYRALATGCKSGLIEIVTNAQTIANIQLSIGKVGKINAAFQKSSLLKWLKEKNKTANELDRAIEDFTYSCAGYCVATYVLGIGDRHNDNIMIKETGQMFHIDFGHFLGNFKSKWGVKRERVPFVLTNDFVHVITRGAVGKTSRDAFEKFQTVCEDSFMTLRRHGNLLITLFAMMLSSGIPELSDSTILYLRESLVLERDDEDARKHFRAKFKEALRESWKTSINWMMHHIAH